MYSLLCRPTSPAKNFGIWPRLFTMFVLILSHFWNSVVTSVRFNSTLSNVEEEKISKNQRKIKKKKIIQKKNYHKKTRKIHKMSKMSKIRKSE